MIPSVDVLRALCESTGGRIGLIFLSLVRGMEKVCEMP